VATPTAATATNGGRLMSRFDRNGVNAE